MEQIHMTTERENTAHGKMVSMMKKSSIHKSKARILVVDDEPQVAEILRDLLVFAGYDVETAENGKQAIDLLMTPRHFDLVITDMKMPEMDGLELLRLTHRLNKTLPIVILTGCATVDNGIQSLEEGAYDYVLKPFNTEKLILVVRQALKSRSLDA
jgi:DNA-binding NtrC family response regulator